MTCHKKEAKQAKEDAKKAPETTEKKSAKN